MNKQLEELYESKWGELVRNSQGSGASYPLLIKVDDDYKNADLRVCLLYTSDAADE